MELKKMIGLWHTFRVNKYVVL